MTIDDQGKSSHRFSVSTVTSPSIVYAYIKEMIKK